MSRKRQAYPTEKEMQILNILWDRGPSTVREVNQIINRNVQTGYTTTLKLMQIMNEKRLLKRDESERTHIYAPCVSEENTQKKVITHLMDQVFSGSAEKLVMRALAVKQVSSDELGRIKDIIDQYEKPPDQTAGRATS